MSNEEWRSRTAEWRRGYNASNNDAPFDESKSEEWRSGYIYALKNPMGGYCPQEVTK